MKTCFKWDNNKAASNLRKHGVSFEAAAQVFEDPFAISIQDQVENGEERWKTIGMSGNCVLLLVAHTVCFEGLEVIRIISARRAEMIRITSKPSKHTVCATNNSTQLPDMPIVFQRSSPFSTWS